MYSGIIIHKKSEKAIEMTYFVCKLNRCGVGRNCDQPHICVLWVILVFYLHPLSFKVKTVEDLCLTIKEVFP
jgi:hypothetical protein